MNPHDDAPSTPFNQPPSTPAVSFEPPESPRSGGRGRMVAVALVTAGLVGGGAIGIGQLASADRPTVSEPDETGDESSDRAHDELPEVSGEIVIDGGDGEPVVVDVGAISGCLSELPLAELFENGEPVGPDQSIDELFDEFFDDGDLPPLDELFEGFDELPLVDGTSVTVTGPDGTQVVELGDDAAVTITVDGGDVSVSTEGDAEVTELDDLFGSFGDAFDGEFDMGALDDFLPDDAELEELAEQLELEFGEFEPGEFELGDIDGWFPPELAECLEGAIEAG